jgi:hypothetical protein
MSVIVVRLRPLSVRAWTRWIRVAPGPRRHAALFSTWKFAAIMPIESFRVAEVAQAVTESGGTEADEIACASRAIIRSMTL